MINDKRIAVVMPAYNAELTLEQTYAEVPHDVVDDVILMTRAGTIQRSLRVSWVSSTSSSTIAISATAVTRRPVIAPRSR